MPDTEMHIPRRVYLPKNIPAEKSIRTAIASVEELPADPRLTDAVVLLGAALDSVADWVDDVRCRRSVVVERADG